MPAAAQNNNQKPKCTAKRLIKRGPAIGQRFETAKTPGASKPHTSHPPPPANNRSCSFQVSPFSRRCTASLKTASRPAPTQAAEAAIHACEDKFLSRRNGNLICTVLRYLYKQLRANHGCCAVPVGKSRAARVKTEAVRVFVVASWWARGLSWSIPDDSPC